MPWSTLLRCECPFRTASSKPSTVAALLWRDEKGVSRGLFSKSGLRKTVLGEMADEGALVHLERGESSEE